MLKDRLYMDFHMHSNCSDGSESVEELFENVKKAGITFFSLTDHDTVKGTKLMAELAQRDGLKFVSGVEFSCLIDITDTDSDCHILGLNYDPDNAEIHKITEKNIANRKNKIYEIADYLRNNFELVLDDEVIKKLVSMDNVGKPQVAEEMVKAGFCENRQAAFDLYLNDFVTLLHVSAKEAIEAIIAAGGIAVWAHPIGDEPEYGNHDTGEKFAKQLASLMSFGIKGLECCYSRYNNKEIEFLIDTARKNGLYISGGSDYHGNRKNVKLVQTGCENTYQEYINITEAF